MKTLRRYQTWLADSARWDGFEFRTGDIVISTPAKCGTTWLQMICALLVFADTRLARPLTELSPWLDLRTVSRPEISAALEAQPHRRFIKTHTSLDGLPFDERVTYLCVGRDPRDVAISSDSHLENMNREVLAKAVAGAPVETAQRPASPLQRLWRWAEEAAPPEESLELLLHHLATFWKRRHADNVVLLHYDDLQTELEQEMRRLAGRLGIVVGEQLWPELVAAAGFDRMRARAGELAPQVTMAGLWSDPGRFFHRGVSGQWRSLLSASDVDRYWARVHRLATPDLVAWTHSGGPAAASTGGGWRPSRPGCRRWSRPGGSAPQRGGGSPPRRCGIGKKRCGTWHRAACPARSIRAGQGTGRPDSPPALHLAARVSPVSQPALCVLDVADLPFEEAVTRTRRRTLSAYKHAYYDPNDLDALLERVSRERGEQVDIACCFNDRNPPSAAGAGEPVPTEDEVGSRSPRRPSTVCPNRTVRANGCS